MRKVRLIVVALALGSVGLFSAASALVALVYGFSGELPQAERLPTLVAGGVFGLLAAGCLGGSTLLIVKALKRPPAT
ncbi:MAG: hypothetical protein Q8L14_30135 [Myxococcales bacterium]|nr:hypothetical protein [Myxococcales bacterium]